MRLITAILATGLAAGTAWGQSPTVVNQVQQKLAGVQQQQTAQSNAAVAATQGQSSGASKQAASSSQGAPASSSKKTNVTVVPMVQPKESGKPSKKSKAAAKPAAAPAKPVEAEAKPAEDKKAEEPKAVSMVGRRDPFISPIVSHVNGGSGCSTGKRCLAVDQIALQGIVKSNDGMIAIVVNALNKAYFLRENDPVFNGYVVKITGDSIVFKETITDELGKPLTREITKKISTPVV